LHDAVRNERATAAATAVEERQERQAVEKKLEDMRERRDDCERQYLAANSRETNLKIELKHANDKIEHQCEEIKRLQYAIIEKNDRISELEGQIAGFRQQVEGTNTEGRVTNAELTAVRKQLKDTRNDRNDLRITLAERDRTLQSWREFVFNQSMEDPDPSLERDVPAIFDHLQACLRGPWNVTSVHIRRSAQQ
jgi:chromosome segregation ATPase